jgi:hypothetical protein
MTLEGIASSEIAIKSWMSWTTRFVIKGKDTCKLQLGNHRRNRWNNTVGDIRAHVS